MINLDYINQICIDLGGTGGHKYDIHALNEICGLLGATAGHDYEIHALNAICTALGYTAGWRYEIEALNAICTGGGGTGGHQYEIHAWQEIQTGSLLNYNPASDSDLNTWHKSLSSDILQESKLNDLAHIVPIVGQILPSNYAKRDVVGFGKNDTSGFIEAMVYYEGNTFQILTVSDTATTTINMQFYIANNSKVFFLLNDGVANGGVFVGTADENTLNVGWHKIKVQSNGSAYSIFVDDIEQTVTASGGATNNGKWLSSLGNDVANNICVGALVRTSTAASYTGKVAWINYNNANYWIFNTRTGFVYDIIGGMHLTWIGSGVHHSYDLKGSLHPATIGYSLYQKSGSDDIQVPYALAGTPLVTTDIPSGYTKTRDIAGSTTYWNKADACFDFNRTVRKAGGSYVFGFTTENMNLNTASGIRNWIALGRKTRIRQTGLLYGVQLQVAYNAGTSAFKIQVWRLVDGVYTLIHNIDVVSKLGTVDKLHDIIFDTPIAVQEGDFWGLCITNNSATNLIYATGGNANSVRYYDAEQATGADWASGTGIAKNLIINGIITRPVIAGIGDSIMAGQIVRSSYIEEVYATEDNTTQIMYQLYLLNNKLIYQNLGFGGNKTVDILARVRSQLLRANPIYAIIQGGINDIANSVDITITLANITAMVDLCIANGIYPIVPTVTAYTNGTTAMLQARDTLNASIISTLSSKALVVNMDALGVFRAGGDAGNLWNLNPSYTADGTHLNLAGDTKFAETIYAAIVAAGLKIPDLSKLEQFNRSNTTIHSAASRASAFYNAQYPYRYHISELSDFTTLTSYFESGYDGKVFPKVDTDKIEEILNYATNKTGADLIKIQKYCGIV